MNIKLKIALGAIVIIIVSLSIGFFSFPADDYAECEEMNRSLYEQELAFNQSAEHYRYRTENLDGEFDLPGDLAAWRNHLLNENNQIQHEINNMEHRCQSDSLNASLIKSSNNNQDQ